MIKKNERHTAVCLHLWEWMVRILQWLPTVLPQEGLHYLNFGAIFFSQYLDVFNKQMS